METSLPESPLKAPDRQSVLRAQKALQAHLKKTPVMTSRSFDRWSGRELFFKCENLQRTGSFKIRGAMNAVLSLPAETQTVVTHSSGNHAQALAYAARAFGKRAIVVMPENAPQVKRQAVLDFGATIISCANSLQARESAAAEALAQYGGVFVPPYNHPDVISGQGTIALELFEQVENLDAIVAPVGGGGMISGIALAALGTQVRVWGAEPEIANDAARSKASNRLIVEPGPNTVADGLRTALGSFTWPIVRDHVEEIFTASEEEIIAATRLVFERLKLVIEPSAGVSVAVSLSQAMKTMPKDLKRIGVVLCGGNVDLDRLPWQ